MAFLQVALAGRAVRRISEATGRPASTLSRLVHDIEDAGHRIEAGTVIFDESSMLDTPSIYRVLAQLPIEVNLIFIGDPGQLPPIGPGLPFHTMVKARGIRSVALDIVHPQADATGIPAVASAVRTGKPVSLATEQSGRSLVYLAWNGLPLLAVSLNASALLTSPAWPPRQAGHVLSNGRVSVAVSRVATVKISCAAS